MASNTNGAAHRNGNQRRPAPEAAAAELPANGTREPAPTPTTVELRARVRGQVYLRIRILDPKYTAVRIARMLNGGNAAWDGENPARYHRIKSNGRVIAEIEYADEDTSWERYEAD